MVTAVIDAAPVIDAGEQPTARPRSIDAALSKNAELQEAVAASQEAVAASQDALTELQALEAAGGELVPHYSQDAIDADPELQAKSYFYTFAPEEWEAICRRAEDDKCSSAEVVSASLRNYLDHKRESQK